MTQTFSVKLPLREGETEAKVVSMVKTSDFNQMASRLAFLEKVARDHIELLGSRRHADNDEGDYWERRDRARIAEIKTHLC